jgi:hypothetical protein
MKTRLDSPTLLLILACVLCAFLSVLIGRACFFLNPFNADTGAFLFQAQLFSHGKLYLPAPPELGFISSSQINVNDGMAYSKYPFGNSLLLTLGVLLGIPWIVPTLLTALTLALVYQTTREIQPDKRIARVAVVLGLISPAMIGLGSAILAETVSRFFLGLFLLTFFRMIRLRSSIAALISGFALGYALDTRPQTAVLFGGAAFGYALFCKYKSAEKSFLYKQFCLFLVPLSVMIGLHLAWNHYFTGNAFKETHAAVQPSDGLGFGKRGMGINLDPSTPEFTPKKSAIRLIDTIIPVVSLNVLGWGYYRPDELSSWWNKERPFPILSILLLLPYLLMLIPLFHSTRTKADVLFSTIFLLNFILYFFFWAKGSPPGFTPMRARYYNESTVLLVIPLVAKGLLIVFDEMKRRLRGKAVPIAGLCAGLLFLNAVYSCISMIEPSQHLFTVFQDLPREVLERHIHNAVIFIPKSRNAPVGEYPFFPPGNADIVYFKNGPDREWNLDAVNWKTAYQRYFQGRDAYSFDERTSQLTPLFVKRTP